jgi:hypothetical protein
MFDLFVRQRSLWRWTVLGFLMRIVTMLHGVALMSVLALPTHSSTIGISVSKNAPLVGETFGVYFTVSGLTSATGDSLSAFDFDIIYDDSKLSLTGYGFDDPALGNQLDLAEVGKFAFVGDLFDFGGGLLDVYGLSGNSDTVLDADQASAFRFLILSFQTLVPTSSTLIEIDLADPFLAVLNSGFGDLAYSFSSSGVTVTVSDQMNNVPEPTLILLFGTGLLLVWRSMSLRLPTCQLTTSRVQSWLERTATTLRTVSARLWQLPGRSTSTCTSPAKIFATLLHSTALTRSARLTC